MKELLTYIAKNQIKVVLMDESLDNVFTPDDHLEDGTLLLTLDGSNLIRVIGAGIKSINFKDGMAYIEFMLPAEPEQKDFEFMHESGGMFMRNLCTAMMYADSSNLRKLYMQYPELVEGYSQWSKGKPFVNRTEE